MEAASPRASVLPTAPASATAAAHHASSPFAPAGMDAWAPGREAAADQDQASTHMEAPAGMDACGDGQAVADQGDGQSHMPHLVDFDFTAHMEARLDEIARGEADYATYLQCFYRDGFPNFGEVASLLKSALFGVCDAFEVSADDCDAEDWVECWVVSENNGVACDTLGHLNLVEAVADVLHGDVHVAAPREFHDDFGEPCG